MKSNLILKSLELPKGNEIDGIVLCTCLTGVLCTLLLRRMSNLRSSGLELHHPENTAVPGVDGTELPLTQDQRALEIHPPATLEHVQTQRIDLPLGDVAVDTSIMEYLSNPISQIPCQLTGWPEFFIHRSWIVEYFGNQLQSPNIPFCESNTLMVQIMFKSLVEKFSLSPIVMQDQYDRFFEIIDIVNLCHTMQPIQAHLPNACIAFALSQGLQILGAQTIAGAMYIERTFNEATSATRATYAHQLNHHHQVDHWSLLFSTLQRYSTHSLTYIKHLGWKYRLDPMFWGFKDDKFWGAFPEPVSRVLEIIEFNARFWLSDCNILQRAIQNTRITNAMGTWWQSHEMSMRWWESIMEVRYSDYIKWWFNKANNPH